VGLEAKPVRRAPRSWLSILFFWWVVPILSKSNETILEADMVDDLEPENTAE